MSVPERPNSDFPLKVMLQGRQSLAVQVSERLAPSAHAQRYDFT